MLASEEREAKLREEQQKLDMKEEMRQAERVFKMIHDYCGENLSISYNLLDKHIEDLLDPKCTVSPLLKYFNDLAKHCYLRLPAKNLLKFDQMYYKKFV